MKNDFVKIIFHPQEPSPALPQATRTIIYWRSKICNFLPPDTLKKLLLDCNKTQLNIILCPKV
jgi:hypothetical protein